MMHGETEISMPFVHALEVHKILFVYEILRYEFLGKFNV